MIEIINQPILYRNSTVQYVFQIHTIQNFVHNFALVTVGGYKKKDNTKPLKVLGKSVGG